MPNKNSQKPIAFFDMDGTLVAPFFLGNGEPAGGFPAQDWMEYCRRFQTGAYDDAFILWPIIRLARDLEAAGCEIRVLTVVLCPEEAAAKLAWREKAGLRKLFHDIKFIDNDDEKIAIVSESAKSGRHTILVDDRYDVVLRALANGVHAISVSQAFAGLTGPLSGLGPDKRPYRKVTRRQLARGLKTGMALRLLLTIRPGQGCEIVKAPAFEPGDTVIYMPDLWLHEIPTDEPVTDTATRDCILDLTFTGDMFLKLCGGDMGLAKEVFDYCDWQHPATALDEILRERRADNRN